jgi:hypothetical protein
MNKAERAKTLLTDDWFKGELDALRSQFITEILNSRESDIEEREKAYLKVRFLDEIIAHFQSIADSDQIVKKRWKIL